jgi:SAM-dependent methyltransferase
MVAYQLAHVPVRVPTLSPIDRIQYNLLRRIAPTEPATMNGAAYAGKSKLRVLLGDEVMLELCRARRVIDFGCGDGAESVELAMYGASVIGVDVREEALARARVRAAAAGVASRCAFTTTPKPADAIVSIDAFEHFDEPASILQTMWSMLRPGGKAYVSFGPTWYHPLGGHLFSVFPWAHLLFSEAALCAWRSHIRSDGATRFREVEGGLNQMTIGRFEQLVHDSPFILETLEYIPIRAARRMHCRVTREWTTAVVRAVLLHSPASGQLLPVVSDVAEYQLAGTP